MASNSYKFNFPGFQNNIRAYRIRQIIEDRIKSNQKFNIKANIEMIQDTKDCLAEEILPKILKMVDKAGKSHLQYYDQLNKWDFIMSKNSRIATIYSILEYKLSYLLI